GGRVPTGVVAGGGGARDPFRRARRRRPPPRRLADPRSSRGARDRPRGRDVRTSSPRAALPLARARHPAPRAPRLPARPPTRPGPLLSGPSARRPIAALGRTVSDRLTTTRESYDRLAKAYVEHVAGELAGKPLD